jgi:hypothetical protein
MTQNKLSVIGTYSAFVWAIVAVTALQATAQSTAYPFIPSSESCQKMSTAIYRSVEIAHQELRACEQEHEGSFKLSTSDPNYLGKWTCPNSGYVTARACLPYGQTICRLEDKKQRIALCLSEARTRELMAHAEKKRDLEGVDEALDASSMLNRLRVRTSPSEQLSRRISKLAYDRLENSSRNALADFDAAFEAFDASGTSGEPFHREFSAQHQHNPLTETSEHPVSHSLFGDEFTGLQELAGHVGDKEYELPVGSELTAFGEPADRFAKDVAATLEGDYFALNGTDTETAPVNNADFASRLRTEIASKIAKLERNEAAREARLSAERNAQQAAAKPQTSTHNPAPTRRSKVTLTRLGNGCFEFFSYFGRRSIRNSCSDVVYHFHVRKDAFPGERQVWVDGFRSDIGGIGYKYIMGQDSSYGYCRASQPGCKELARCVENLPTNGKFSSCR